MTVSDRFVALIETLEGFKAQAYQDINGHMTIGFGHLIKDGEQFGTLTREEAEALLRKDVMEAEAYVNSFVRVVLKQEQFDALVSFVFNIGAGNFQHSTLLRKLNAGHCCAVPDEMRRWSNGQNRGLLDRRTKEVALYTGDF